MNPRTRGHGTTMLACLAISVLCAPVPYARKASATPPQNDTPDEIIYDLYNAGKTEEARREVEKFVNYDSTSNLATRQVKDESGMAAKVSEAGSLSSCYAGCLYRELVNGTAVSLPQSLLRGFENSILTTDKVIREAKRSAYADSARVKRSLGYAESENANLLCRRIQVAVTQDGKARALELYEKHKEFLLAQGISAEKAMEQLQKPKRTYGATVSMNGQHLVILQAVLDYYQAASRQDAAALDALLLPGPKNATGKEVLDGFRAELGRDGDFDTFASVRFDEKTSLSIQPTGENSFEVHLNGVLMTLTGHGKSIVQRNNCSQTVVKLKDGEYKIVQGKRSRG